MRQFLYALVGLALFNFSQRLKQNPITLLGFCFGCSTLRNQYGLLGSTELTDSIFFLFALFQVDAHWVEEKSFTKITPRTNDITKMFAFVDIHSFFFVQLVLWVRISPYSSLHTKSNCRFMGREIMGVDFNFDSFEVKVKIHHQRRFPSTLIFCGLVTASIY